MATMAVVAIGDKQYQVKEGDKLEVQHLEGQVGKVEFDQVLLVANDDNIEIGTPYVKEVKVFASLVEHKKGDKLQVFKYKSKSKYRKMRGARQLNSYLVIDSIGKEAKKEVKNAEKQVAKIEKKATKPAAKKSKAKTAKKA